MKIITINDHQPTFVYNQADRPKSFLSNDGFFVLCFLPIMVWLILPHILNTAK
ncbi:MAG: hypothetical protein GX781_06440 [Clostridiales bacterium]|nr:hypothetical protein [Clostridiales bacterium]